MDKRALFMFTILFVAGLFLFGEGITGLYIMEFQQEPCGKEFDCGDGKVCCNFYNEEFGVCDTEDKCDDISRVTFDARRKVSSYDTMSRDEKYTLFSTMSVHVEAPKTASNTYSLIAGIILVLVAFIGIFIGKVRDIHAGKSHSLYRTKEEVKGNTVRKKKAKKK
ncbi:MAG: hypothetical protein PHO02_05840 [Candidatus Nanoarchaeia archaeon]|nr:hypothetical protein [Candidatus Nanoarchaeia archaeon]